MTWEETILYIRKKEEFKRLVKDSYLDADLKKNIKAYNESEEFQEIEKILFDLFNNNHITIADVGSGNGITAVNFALLGHTVYAIEPYNSSTVGSGAIEKLKNELLLDNISVKKEFGENISINNNIIDLYFARQAMHHADNLSEFVREATRILRPGGYFFTIRDHVVLNQKDKKLFFESHPLHKYYGGENAYTLNEYISSIENAGLKLIKIIKYYDSAINYSPLQSKDLLNLPVEFEQKHRNYFYKKYPLISKIPGSFIVYKWKNNLYKYDVLNEKNIPGRLYSFIAQKK